tara:strand:+ start:65 stop:412 length:348 start_codon:yes stop_codon:yes gene_type:complete
LDQEWIRVAVVAPLKLDNLLATGVRAHDSQNGQARLGTRIAESNHFHGRYSFDDHLCQGVFQLARRAERGTFFELLDQRRVDLIIGMTANSRTPGADVVDVLVSIDIERVCLVHW